MSSVDAVAAPRSLAPLIMLYGEIRNLSPSSGLQSSSQILKRQVSLIQFYSLQPVGPNPKRFAQACAVDWSQSYEWKAEALAFQCQALKHYSSGPGNKQASKAFEALRMINRPKAPAWSQMEIIRAPVLYVCVRTGAALKEFVSCLLAGSWQICRNTVWLSVQTWSGD